MVVRDLERTKKAVDLVVEDKVIAMELTKRGERLTDQDKVEALDTFAIKQELDGIEDTQLRRFVSEHRLQIGVGSLKQVIYAQAARRKLFNVVAKRLESVLDAEGEARHQQKKLLYERNVADLLRDAHVEKRSTAPFAIAEKCSCVETVNLGGQKKKVTTLFEKFDHWTIAKQRRSAGKYTCILHSKWENSHFEC